ncbi:hypothetical protein BB559_000712 [Furculomyces boomerangus]|uniref:Uncharacterized protein n=1 Tax=Furculomyces boomerangus TaxID=61424 RepID=A0A2T9Z4H3_9FUNG|nr:hypothetical protein BB559_000712 [Furculomyces boomerangus]
MDFEIDLMISNLKAQFQTTMHFPLKISKMRPYYYHNILSLVFGVLLIICFLVIILNLILNSQSNIGLAIFFYILGLNLFVMTRQHLYNIRRLYLNTKYDIQILVLESTSYKTFNRRSFMNWVQISILVMEFFQLASFPAKEMLNYKGTFGQSMVNNPILVTLQNFENSISWRFFHVQFWVFFSLVFILLCFFSIAIYTNKFWKVIKYMVPIISLLYLPVLALFLSSVGCLEKLNPNSKNNSVLIKCDIPGINKNLYTAAALAAYTVGYSMFTLVVTTFDNLPIKGDIQYKSMGTAFIKNMSMLMSINSLLVSDQLYYYRTVVLTVVILSMLCFNLRAQPSYYACNNGDK